MAASRPAPMFVADALGLDVLNTVAAPWGSEIEWIGNGLDLLAWLEQAHLVPTEVAEAMRAGAALGDLDTVAAEARALREWFRQFVRAHAGKAIGSDVLDELHPLSRLLERDQAYGAIVLTATGTAASDVDSREHGSGLRWRWNRRWGSADTLLLPIAQAMADLVCEADFAQVKHCEGTACTMLFLDTTKGQARRWCSMAACGNRAKQAAHRARLRGPGRRQPTEPD